MALEGEGTALLLAFIGALVLIIIAIVAWFLIKKKQAVYTYQYGMK